jgi:hypothetical protein
VIVEREGLGSAALTVLVFFFLIDFSLILARLFGLFLLWLAWLAALLPGARLPFAALLALLSHIVCHDVILLERVSALL